VIVRLMGDTQYELDDACVHRLNDLDTEASAALEPHDQTALEQRLQAMWELVRREGAPLSSDALSPSDAVVPPFDMSLDEARRLLGDDGFIPDPPAA
jgi:hypothetical protein